MKRTRPVRCGPQSDRDMCTGIGVLYANSLVTIAWGTSPAMPSGENETGLTLKGTRNRCTGIGIPYANDLVQNLGNIPHGNFSSVYDSFSRPHPTTRTRTQFFNGYRSFVVVRRGRVRLRRKMKASPLDLAAWVLTVAMRRVEVKRNTIITVRFLSPLPNISVSQKKKNR
jgi:hypothetical protein